MGQLGVRCARERRKTKVLGLSKMDGAMITPNDILMRLREVQ